MSELRLTRVNELIRREVAASIYRVVNNPGFDLSAITISRVVVNSDLRRAKVMVSIRDHEEDKQKMIRVLRRHAHDFHQHLSKHIKLKYIPRLVFILDDSIGQGDRVLQLLSDIEGDKPEWDWEDESTEPNESV